MYHVWRNTVNKVSIGKPEEKRPFGKSEGG
jgi:hypothetical protein